MNKFSVDVYVPGKPSEAYAGVPEHELCRFVFALVHEFGSSAVMFIRPDTTGIPIAEEVKEGTVADPDEVH